MPDKPGRPEGYSKRDEQASEKLTIMLTPTDYQWVKKQPRGYVADLIESARKKSTR